RQLRLRCYAAARERRGGRSHLGELFRAGVDPVRFLAWKVSNRERAREGAGEVSLTTFDNDEELDLRRYDRWMRISRTLLEFVPRGLAANQIREILRKDGGVDLTPHEADGLIAFVIDDVLGDPGRPVVVDRTFEVLAENLGCEVEDVLKGLSPTKHEE